MSTSKQPENSLPLVERSWVFLQRARALRGLSSAELARIARRLEAPRPRGQRRTLLRACAAATLLLTVGTAVAWASGALERLPGFHVLFGPAKDDPAPLAKAIEPRPPVNPSGPTTAAAPELADEPDRPRAMAHRRVSTPASRPQPQPPEPSESVIVLEGRSFGRALELWRARRDGKAALAALDEHDRRFAAGQMRTEAVVLRAEILLAARNERAALAALDRVALDNAPRGRELRTLRGELRVRFDRCQDARSDLEVVARGTDVYAARAREALIPCR